MLETILLGILVVLNLVAVVILLLRKGIGVTEWQQLGQQLAVLEKDLARLESAQRAGEADTRAEISKSAAAGRKELADNLRDFKTDLHSTLKHITELNQQGLGTINQTLATRMDGFNELQKQKLEQLDKRQQEMVKQTEVKLESIRVTVAEKLEKTLSERLGQSFETVGKQLIEVQKGLGEMQSIAADVGGLKRALTNVKLRGGIGEIQLAMLLEEILSKEQFEANVATRPGSNERVEFAIKLPGREVGKSTFVWLPIDAKFPKDAYEHLLAAYETADNAAIQSAQKGFEDAVKKAAKDISQKYLCAPHTTDFGILFAPFESIYAEIARRAGLLEVLQRDFKVIVAGPTNLAALLNALQMGFKTLAIEKRSAEIWALLAEVKGEFEKFSGLLDRARKSIQTGLNQIDDVSGTRTRAIQRKLRNVQTLPDLIQEEDPIN